MRIHIKILGFIYTGIAALWGVLGLFAVLTGGFTVGGICALMVWWFGNTGLKLIKLHPDGWYWGLVVGLVLMLLLNVSLLFADEGKFAASLGQKIFHIACVAIGLDTVIVLLLRGGRAAFD